MNKQKRKILVVILFILLIFLFLSKRDQNNNKFQDELIFFKLFSSSQQKNEIAFLSQSKKNSSIQQYYFQVAYKNIDFKNILLTDTIDKNTLIHEKIAPGTQGAFEILLQANKKVNYQIKFKSKNEKPKNLNFEIEGKDRKYSKLEDMEQDLKGEIEKNTTITIHWKWEYEKDSREDLQDTKDGQTIKQYNFTISAIGE